MKICIDLTSLFDNFSGIERFAFSITKELIKDKNNYYILLFKQEIFKGFNSFPFNVQPIVIKSTFYKHKLFFNQLVLPMELKKINADKFIFLAFPAPYFFSNKKTISAIHDLNMWDCRKTNKWYMNLYFKIMYKKASTKNKKIITVSNFSKRRIVDILKVNPSNIAVIYDGIADTFTSNIYCEEDDIKSKKLYKIPKNYILCLSTVEPRKNIRLLIEAYTDLIKNSRLSLDLVIVGRKGWLIGNLLKNVDDFVKEKIHFTGFVDEDLLPYIYKNAYFFIFPSLYEGFGVPPLEAMSCGTPVISSNAEALIEICGNAALFFNKKDKNELKTAILRMLNLDSTQRESLIKTGYQQIKKFSWRNESKKLLSFISY